MRRYQIHSEKSEIEAAGVNECWGMTFSPNWENIIILSQEFPHYGKIFRFGLAQPCTYASPPLPLTLLYVSVCVGSRACLQLFTYDSFSTQDDPPALPPPPPPCRALLSPTFSLVLFSPSLLFSASFHPMSAFLSCLKPFILSCNPPHPPHNTSTTTNPHPSPSLPLHISPNLEVSHLYSGLTSNGCVSPSFLTSSLYPPNSAPPSLFQPHNILSCQGNL